MSFLKFGTLVTSLFTVLAACSLGTLRLASAQSVFPNGERLEFESNGHTISVPYFDPTLESVTPDRKAFEMNALAEFQAVSNETLWAAFYDRKRFGLLKYMVKSTSTLLRARCAYLALPNASRQPPMTARFTNSLYNMWIDTFRKANTLYLEERTRLKAEGRRKPAKLSEAAVVQFIGEMNDYSATMAEVVSRSPTGLHMDWSKMTISGAPATEVAKHLVLFARRNGFNFLIYLASKFANTLKDFDWNSEKSPKRLDWPMKTIFALHRCPKKDRKLARQQRKARSS